MKKAIIVTGTLFLIFLISLNFTYGYALGSKYERFMRFFLDNREAIIQQIKIALAKQLENVEFGQSTLGPEYPGGKGIPSTTPTIYVNPKSPATDTQKLCVETGGDCIKGSDCCEDFLCIEGKCKSECEPSDVKSTDKLCSDNDQSYKTSGKACIFYVPPRERVGKVLCGNATDSVRNRQPGPAICYESDFGDESLRYGATVHIRCTVGEAEAKLSLIHSDFCRNATTLMEYYCGVGVETHLKEITCPDGMICSNGRCMEKSDLPTCKETDNGRNVTVFGDTFLENKDGKIVELYHDECYYAGTNSYGIVERYCDPNDPYVIKTSENLCPLKHNCINGACVNLDPVECVDNDDGIHFETLSNVTKGDRVEYDGCIYDAVAVEYFCYNNDIQSARVNCERGYSCVNGKCVDSLAQPTYGCSCANGRCRDSTGRDKTGYCQDGKAYSFYCKTTNLNGQEVEPYVAGPLVKECKDGKVCEQGYCIPATNVEFTCNETDFSLDSGGVNIYQKGTMHDQIDGKSYTDSCTKNKVVEYSCAFGAGDYRILECENGCQGGACIP